MKHFFWLLLCFLSSNILAQEQPSAAEIRLKLKKLNFLGSVLYMAAHPDDENTRVITYLSNERLAETAYLSLTRGDGGQNLIGPEIGAQLGVIRTQELLAARRIDGGKQFFTRAIDFGFSKSADEAMQIWGKDEILHDVVKVFRMYKPDVIITRFPADARAGHGHHTASAMFAAEAFDVAAQEGAFPELSREFGTWQVKRLYTNTGRWWNRDINESTPGVITLDVGGYSPLLGQSYNEIAALSSSQHKSQGWGRAGERGYSPEFLEYVKGERADNDLFDGINTTWTRIKGGEKIQPLVTKIANNFKDEDPSASVKDLFVLRKAINALDDSIWKSRKLAEVNQLIVDCLGLFTQATASSYFGSPGNKVSITLEVVNRSKLPLQISRIVSDEIKWDTTLSKELNPTEKIFVKTRKSISSDLSYSNPYWLKKEHETGIFSVENKDYIGLPENPAAISLGINVQSNGEMIPLDVPLIYKWTDRVKGELSRPYEVVPPVFINVREHVLVFSDDQPKDLHVQITTPLDSLFSGTLNVVLPDGWKAEPASVQFSFETKGAELHRTIRIFPTRVQSSGSIEVSAEVGGKRYNQELNVINYDHIPAQTLLPKSVTKVVRIDLKKSGQRIGYIRGAGDDIPTALRNMGYEVWEMSNEEITPANLQNLDAVVLGIRALNTNERIRYFMADLLEYTKNGGTVVLQYNTSFEMRTEAFAPFPLTISRDRVTQEDSEVRILKPEHPVLNTPNKITAEDFKGWTQERGLYFPNKWDDNYQAILSINDKEETPKDGSLLVAKFGNGHFVYTGLSFFRQLPYAVPGAYRLFANIVSLGKSQEQPPAKRKTKAGR